MIIGFHSILKWLLGLVQVPKLFVFVFDYFAFYILVK